MPNKTKKIAGVDIDVGFRIKRIREGFGLSQSELAERIGVSFQQVQKYENGKNKVSLNRLCQIAAVFNTDPSSMIQGIEKERDSEKTSTEQGIRSLRPVMNDEERRVLKLFRRIKNAKFKRVILLQLRAFLDLEHLLHDRDEPQAQV